MEKLSAENIDYHSKDSSEGMGTQLKPGGSAPGGFYHELEMTSRYVNTHQEITDSNARAGLHSHSFWELFCCRNTCDAEYLAGTEHYRLKKGDVVVIPPGISHRLLLPDAGTEPCCRDVIWLSQEFISSLGHLLPRETNGEPYLLRTVGTRWDFLPEMFRGGVRESEEQDLGWEEAVLGNSVQILVNIRRALNDHSAGSLRVERPELLERVMAYVEAHLAQKITLGDVAKHFWVSQSTISQTFRNKLGVSFYRFVTQRRLMAAKSLILQGLPLEQINEKVGFTDYSTFYRAFRQEFSISPRQYRKLQENPEHTSL